MKQIIFALIIGFAVAESCSAQCYTLPNGRQVCTRARSVAVTRTVSPVVAVATAPVRVVRQAWPDVTTTCAVATSKVVVRRRGFFARLRARCRN